ncbi:hypothetical protein LCGC14_0474490 [marine sediment metagenome]|uniref:Uncharacterized protein n=1 Tax=marine sediment metagenome TaxID=412755 RepID=A0A0F9SGH4_9ZZZZ
MMASGKMPHRHICKECEGFICHECECPDSRLRALLCDTCADEGELEF